MKNKSIGIIGYGFVGKAVAQIQKMYKTVIYDPAFQQYAENFEAFKQDIVFVCVPTPTEKGEVVLSYVEDSVQKWNDIGSKKSILVLKSTIPAGTTDYFCEKYETSNIVHNPEFLTQRTANHDFLNPLEVIVGGNKLCCDKVVSLYKDFYKSYSKKSAEIQYFSISSRQAELLKTVRNSFYATKVSFFNEIYDLCNALDIEYDSFISVFTLGGAHPWIGNQHVFVPGPDGKLGFGGACLPKDSEGLLDLSKKMGVDMLVLEAAIKANKRRTQ